MSHIFNRFGEVDDIANFKIPGFSHEIKGYTHLGDQQTVIHFFIRLILPSTLAVSFTTSPVPVPVSISPVPGIIPALSQFKPFPDQPFLFIC